jgi:hypothetical protein
MATFGRDTPLDRPNPGGRAAVFVPADGADETVTGPLKNGAGLVGFGNRDGSVTVYFESNKFNDSSLFKWEHKTFKAYDRMVKLAPTVNKLTTDAEQLVQVGFIESQEILVRDMEALARWLARSGVPDTMPDSPNIYAGK